VKQEIKMITPEPVIMTGESGRLFEFELGRHERNHSQSKENLEPVAPADGTQHTEESETTWVPYRFNQAANLVKQRIATEQGLLKVSGLTYVVDDQFKGGSYEI
jgi:hypothetical protein